jgi:hypothetical protein
MGCVGKRKHSSGSQQLRANGSRSLTIHSNPARHRFAPAPESLYNRALLRTIDDFTLGASNCFSIPNDIPVAQTRRQRLVRFISQNH